MRRSRLNISKKCTRFCKACCYNTLKPRSDAARCSEEKCSSAFWSCSVHISFEVPDLRIVQNAFQSVKTLALEDTAMIKLQSLRDTLATFLPEAGKADTVWNHKYYSVPLLRIFPPLKHTHTTVPVVDLKWKLPQIYLADAWYPTAWSQISSVCTLYTQPLHIFCTTQLKLPEFWQATECFLF